MKITFFEVPKKEQEIFISGLVGMEVFLFEEKLTEENAQLAKDSDIVSVFVNSVVNKNIIGALPNLKLIATRSAGFDHIDRETCATKGILVSNVPAYGTKTVAEFAFALILTLSRKMREAASSIKENGDYVVPLNVQGFDLNGKTLGVVGTGKIGKNVIHIAHGFNMNVVAYDLYPDLTFAKDNNFTYKKNTYCKR